jgi:hypothetical protein
MSAARHSCDLTKKKTSIQSLNFAQKTIFTLSTLALFYLVLGDIVYLLITDDFYGFIGKLSDGFVHFFGAKITGT